MVVVLEDGQVKSELDFVLGLPEGAELRRDGDGGFSILAPVEIDAIAPGEKERIEREFDEILGASFDYDNDEPTAEQRSKLDAIEPAAMVKTREKRVIGTIAAPWAVDAEGRSLPTRYVLDGQVLRQVIETDESTRYPVTADPSFWWYVAKAGECLVAVASWWNVAGKAAQIGLKIFKMLKAGKATKKAYDLWRKLGPDNETRMRNFLDQLPPIANLFVKHGYKEAVRRIGEAGGPTRASWGVILGAATIVTDLAGLGSCVSLATGK